VYKNGQLLQTPALYISSRMCSARKSGWTGMALDPSFGTAGNNYVYLYYTFRKAGVYPTDSKLDNPNNPVNGVSRFVMAGYTINPSSEEVLIDNIPSPTGNHNAGSLSFCNDGNLYVTVEDSQCDYAQSSGCQTNNDASRDQNILLGKILRITSSGGIPASNPIRILTAPAATSSDRPWQEVPGHVRLGLEKHLPLRLRPGRLGYALLYRRRWQ
jgi:glucose/arabinose dehydrogenase